MDPKLKAVRKRLYNDFPFYAKAALSIRTKAGDISPLSLNPAQEILDEALSAKTTAEWLAEFGGTVPASPILDIGQAMDNPYLSERDLLHNFPNPASPDEMFRMVAHPIRNEGGTPPKLAAPGLGADTEQLLQELGYENDQITALKGGGIV